MITGNTHFAIGIHVLAALALRDGDLVTSAELAESVHTNPAFLRAVLGRLRDAGLLETRLGKGGGSTLARPASDITLLEVFRATDGEARLATHDCAGGTCELGQKVPAVLEKLGQQLDAAMARELETVRVSDIAREVRPT
ncbi:MAG: Rrf2 family transcriptional regulator [Myxococcota bacterium]